MKKILILCFFLTIGTNVSALSIPWEKQTGYLKSGVYGWNYSYDIGFYDETLRVNLAIKLVGDEPGETLLNRWEAGIENIWSTERFSTPITFNLDWVESNYDHRVNVINSSGRSNMLKWYSVGVSGWGDPYQEALAAHEAGHMFGLWDEYLGGGVDPVTGLINTGGLMQTLWGPTLDYYYDHFYAWLDEKILTPVPEPTTMLLFGTGLVGLAAFGRRRKAE